MHSEWHRTSDSINYAKNKAFLSTNIVIDLQAKTVCVFSHIPKTGGTSLENIVAKNFDLSDVLHINAPDLNELPALLSVKKNHPKVICGHHPMHGQLYQLLDDLPIFHFTMLRDPLDRVLSYYNYIRGKTDHPLHSFTAAENSLLQFLHKNPSPELVNGQSRRLTGYLHSGDIGDLNLVDEAKEVLTHCFSLVLTTCLFDESLLLLKQRLNLQDIFYQKRNVSQRFIKKADLTDTELNFIMEKNQADSALFSWVKDKTKALIKQNITAEQLNTFKKHNATWNKMIQEPIDISS